MEEGHTVWVTHPEHAWTLGVVTAKVVNDDGSMRIEVKVPEEEAPRVITATAEAGGASASELPEVKAVNEEGMEDRTEGRGGVDDLIDLTHLHEPAILHVLATRFRNDIIYTYTGPILLAVNPFQRLPIYTKETLQQYYSRGLLVSQGVNVDKLPPHVYATADAAYRCMKDSDSNSRAVANRNQSLLVSGESGAGKTVTTKIIMQYLATVGRPQGVTEIHAARTPAAHHHHRERRPSSTDMGSGGAGGMPPTPHRMSMAEPVDYGNLSTPHHESSHSHDLTPKPSIEDRVLQSNPILEAFGNAKTVRNENSSRFGKFIELDFSSRCHLVGAQIETYLLEKVRLVFQAKGERNYHVFYQLCAGSDAEQRARWKIGSPESYSYLNQSGCMTLTEVLDKDEWEATKSAMDTMGFAYPDQDAIFTALAGLLHLGNVKFVADGEKSAVDPSTMESANIAAELIGASVDELVAALTSKKIHVAGSSMTTYLDVAKATDARDGLTKNIYSKMFDWIVAMINTNIKPVENHAMFIGVLDIFGFEHFKFNSFEQLCINYANETLQQQFNEFVFKLEQAEYTRENIEWKSIVFEDNKDCLELIEGRQPPGILALIDEQCLVKGGPDDDKAKGRAEALAKGRGDEPVVTQADQSLAQKLYKNLEAHPRFLVEKKDRPKFAFSVRHYAGVVTYSTAGFVEKNKDQIHDELSDIVQHSTNGAVAVSYRWVDEAQKARAAQAAADGGGGKKKAGSQLLSETVGAQFKRQLAQLLGIIKSTTPHYVRCIKPNPQSVPKEFARPDVVGQLRCGGVLEAVRVARLGYPVRLLHPLFMSQYRCLLPKGFPLLEEGGDVRQYCKNMAVALQVESDLYQVGLTKVFFKKGAYGDLEGRRTKLWRATAVHLQAFFRMRQARNRWRQYYSSMLRLQFVYRRRRKLRHSSSRVISKFMRREAARIRNKRFRKAVVTMQSHQRRRVAKRSVHVLRQNTRATQIQSVLKMIPRRRMFKLQRAKAIIVQCAIRSAIARRKLKKLKQEAKELGNLKDQNVQLQQEVRQLKAQVAGLQGYINQLQVQLAAASQSAPGTTQVQIVYAQPPPTSTPTTEGADEGAPTQAKSEHHMQQDTSTSPMVFPSPELSVMRAELAMERQRYQQLESQFAAYRMAMSTGTSPQAPQQQQFGGDGGGGGEEGVGGEVGLSDVSVSFGGGMPSTGTGHVSSLGDFGTFGQHGGVSVDKSDILVKFEAKEAQYRREIQALQKRVQRAEKQSATAAGSRLQAEQKTKDLTTRNQELEGELRRVTQQFERAKKQAEDHLTTTVKAYKTQVEAMTEKIASDEDTLQDLRKRLQLANQESKADKETIDRLNRKIREQLDTIDSLQKAKQLDSDVKMALAQRLDQALIDRNEREEEHRKVVMRLEDAVRKAMAAGGGGSGGGGVTGVPIDGTPDRSVLSPSIGDRSFSSDHGGAPQTQPQSQEKGKIGGFLSGFGFGKKS